MFHCERCGLCCQALAGVELMKDLDRGDGTCIYFDEKTRLCTIYEHRPLICRVDEGYEAFFSQQMTREEYEQLNYAACRALQSGLRPEAVREKRLCEEEH